MNQYLLSISFLLFSVHSAQLFAELKPATDCSSNGSVNYLCGPENTEDLIFIPDSSWMLASGGSFGKEHGELYLIDTKEMSWHVMFPDSEVNTKRMTSSCDGLPDQAKFSPHGIGLSKRVGETYDLYVVNHGGREAVEIFTVKLGDGVPTVSWKDCVLLPENVYANGVAPLVQGGFVVSKFFDPSIPGGMASIGTRENIGVVLEWHAKTGFVEIEQTESFGSNGILVSEDDRWVYSAAWGDKELIRVDRTQNLDVPRDVLSLDFLPDNLRWGDSGDLIVAGHFSTPLFGCNDTPQGCKPGWKIVRVAPDFSYVETLFSIDKPVFIEKATVATEKEGTIWVGSYDADRIAHIKITENN